MLRLYYGGSEIPGHRKLLHESGVEHVALSYMGLRRRVQFSRPWVIAEKYPDEQRIFLDSGAYTVNKRPDDYTDAELMEIAEKYYAFASENESRLDMVSEFDALKLGSAWIGNMRELYAPRFGDKFVPIWHPGYGLTELEAMAERYRRVGVPQTALGERDLTPVLSGLHRRYGTLLHGVAMTKVAPLYEAPFATVSSTSWLSPSQYGDTIVWVSNTLKRYPNDRKDEARRRHFGLFQEHGFDADAIVADDPKEVLRLSIWSWERLVEDVNRRRPEEVVTGSVFQGSGGNAEPEGGEVGNQGSQTRNSREVVPRPENERRTLPFLRREPVTETYTDADGNEQQRTVGHLNRTTGGSLMRCNSCYISSLCGAYKADSDCAYDIPVEMRTKDQRLAVMDTLEEIMVRRIYIGYAMEQVNGGYPDSNVSAEIDRLARFRKMRAEADKQGFSVTVSAEQRGAEMGMIGRIFGAQAGEQARALEASQPTDQALADMGVIPGRVLPADDRHAAE